MSEFNLVKRQIKQYNCPVRTPWMALKRSSRYVQTMGNKREMVYKINQHQKRVKLIMYKTRSDGRLERQTFYN